MTVYHYTDMARLPFILLAGELRPGRNTIGGFSDPDFLWATTSPIGDQSSSASTKALRAGLTRSVRFVLNEADFTPWPAATAMYPAWTPDQIARLEQAARGRSRPDAWRYRAAPLPRSSWLAVETRSYMDKRWLPFGGNEPVVYGPTGARGIWIGDKAYFSTETEHPTGAKAYEVCVAARDRAA